MTVFESLLNNTFTIARRVRESDGQGGWSITYSDTWTAEGRLRPANSQEREAAAQEERRISHVLYVTADTDIARGDLVTGDGVTVEVQGVREPSRAGHHLEVDCFETQAEESEEAGS